MMCHIKKLIKNGVLIVKTLGIQLNTLENSSGRRNDVITI